MIATKHPNYASGSNEAHSFLAGSHRFHTTGIEVYTKENLAVNNNIDNIIDNNINNVIVGWQLIIIIIIIIKY